MRWKTINSSLEIHPLKFAASLICLLAMLAWAVAIAAAPSDVLGTRWQVFERGWSGDWIRRGDTSTFDARWTDPGQNEIRGVVDIHISGQDVRMTRTDLNTGQRCEYRGQISRDGQTANGWMSCYQGPRMNWNANIIRSGDPFSDNRDVLRTPQDFPGRREGPIMPQYNQNYEVGRYDLTGVWRCNDGGRYYVRQIRNNVWWFGESSNGQWSNIFHGAIDGDWVEGFWLDVPKGRDRDNGALRLRIDSRTEFHREMKTGDDFGGSRWRRER